MSNAKILGILKKYQKAGHKSSLRQVYLLAFKKKMIYRTSKTERPEVTKRMVEKVLSR